MNLPQEVLLFGCSFQIGKAAFGCEAASAHLFDFGDGHKCLRVNGAHNFIGGVEFSPSSLHKVITLLCEIFHFAAASFAVINPVIVIHLIITNLIIFQIRNNSKIHYSLIYKYHNSFDKSR